MSKRKPSRRTPGPIQVCGLDFVPEACEANYGKAWIRIIPGPEAIDLGQSGTYAFCDRVAPFRSFHIPRPLHKGEFMLVAVQLQDAFNGWQYHYRLAGSNGVSVRVVKKERIDQVAYAFDCLAADTGRGRLARHIGYQRVRSWPYRAALYCLTRFEDRARKATLRAVEGIKPPAPTVPQELTAPRRRRIYRLDEPQ